MLFSIMRLTKTLALGIALGTLAGNGVVVTAQKKDDMDMDTQVSNIMTTVNYTDPYDGMEMMGYSVVPSDLNPKDKKDTRPIVVIVPDWDGVNE